MRILSIILIGFTIALFSCGDSGKTINGLNYQKLKKGDGRDPEAGDYAFLHIYVFSDGKLSNSTRQIGTVQPVKVPEMEQVKEIGSSGRPNYLLEAISVMNEGDSILLEIPITAEMRKDPQLANVQELVYHVVMEELKTEEEFKAVQEAEKIKRQEELAIIKAREAEVGEMISEMAEKYAKGELDSELTTTSSGLKYVILKEGSGSPVENGQQVDVHYYGALANGEMFDNSFKRARAYPVKVGVGLNIQGWEEGLQLLKKGEQAVFFIPPQLGYGKAGSDKVPGDAELIYFIEIQ